MGSALGAALGAARGSDLESVQEFKLISIGKIAILERQFRDEAQKQIQHMEWAWKSKIRIGWKLELPLEQQLDNQIWTTITTKLEDQFDEMIERAKTIS